MYSNAVKKCLTAVESFLWVVDLGVDSDRSRRSSNIFIVHHTFILMYLWKTTTCLSLERTNRYHRFMVKSPKLTHFPPSWLLMFWNRIVDSRSWTHRQLLPDLISNRQSAGPELLTVWILVNVQRHAWTGTTMIIN